MHEKIQRFSLRKLSVGLASVMVGACIFSANAETAKADVTSNQTTQTTNVQGQTATTQPQNGKKQTSSDQNSVADQSQKNLMDDLGKQKASTENNQVEAKNQENRLVDQINYKLTNNTSTDSKEDLGQNKVAPDETKQAPTTKSDAEKSIVGSSSAQKINNQSSNHAEDNSQSQNEPKLDITKNSQKLAKKVLATNLIETNSSPTTNGGFDEATWGKLDVNDWQGSVQNSVYQLTGYTGDLNHIIVPNEADFEKAGKSTNGLQVGITSDTASSFLSINRKQTIAFSKTNNQKVKAIGTDWSHTFSIDNTASPLSKFDGSNLDVSSITNMSEMFGNLGSESSISDLTSLAKWDTSNVTDMSEMFAGNKVSDLTPLAKWDTSNVTNMSEMFEYNSINDLTPLANWNVSKVTNMSFMFAENSDLIDLKPIANWNISNVDINNDNDEGFVGLFVGATKLNLTNINNTPLMQGFLKVPDALKGVAFITNNADLVKASTGKGFTNLTKTAKRIITFDLPHAEPKTITQTIYYKTIAPVQIDWSDPDSPQIGKPYPLQDSDWYLDTSKQNDDVIIDGVICFKPVKIPHVNGYKAHLIKDPVNPTAFLVSFMAVPEQPQNNQSNNVQSPQKPAQTDQNQPEPIQTRPAKQEEKDKQIDQLVRTISYTLMHDSSDTADSFEPAQDNSDSFEAPSDSTQKDDATKTEKVNAAKPKKHIAKKHVVKRHKKHAKKYHLKRRSRKHTKRAKKRIMKHRKSVSRKFRKHNLKHVKKN